MGVDASIVLNKIPKKWECKISPQVKQLSIPLSAPNLYPVPKEMENSSGGNKHPS
jgi:hypothetical protein